MGGGGHVAHITRANFLKTEKAPRKPYEKQEVNREISIERLSEWKTPRALSEVQHHI